MTGLTPDEERLLEHYRQKIISEKYTPLTDRQLERVQERRANARASAAIEGLYGTPMDEALFDLFEETRAPGDLRQEILDAYTDDLSARADHPDAAE